MQIVIDIPDEIYEYVKQNYRYGIGAGVACKVGFAVAKGTPLPEKHGDLKDKKDMCCKDCTVCEYTHTCDIYSAPTIIKATALGF